MNPLHAVQLFFLRYIDVHGRSRRFEFVWIVLIQVIAFALWLGLFMSYGVDAQFHAGVGEQDVSVEGLNGFGIFLAILSTLYWLATIIPWITLQMRRFHDLGYSAWLLALFYGLWIIPPLGFFGSIIKFFWLFFGSGTAGVNQYGQDPRTMYLDIFV